MRKPKRAYSPAVTMALFVTAVAMLLGRHDQRYAGCAYILFRYLQFPPADV